MTILVLRLLLSFCFNWENISNTQESVSSAIHANTSNCIKNTSQYITFSTLFLLFGYPDETLSLLFDILLDKATLSNLGLEKREKFQNFPLPFPLAMLCTRHFKDSIALGWSSSKLLYLCFLHGQTRFFVLPLCILTWLWMLNYEHACKVLKAMVKYSPLGGQDPHEPMAHWQAFASTGLQQEKLASLEETLVTYNYSKEY